MRVRLLVEVSGTRNGQPWPARGNEVDLPDEEARSMISALMAVPVVGHRAEETTTVPVLAVEERVLPIADERPLTTRTGPAPGRKAPR